MKSLDSTQKKVAVIIPCHNEATSIAQVVLKFPRDELLKHNILLQTYVIDNNSTDDTATVAKKAGAIVIPAPQQGKGNALRTGFAKVPSDIDYVVMLDGDDTYSSDEVMRLLEPLQNDFCDVVVGSRLHGRIQSTAMSTFNRLGNHLFTMFVRILYRANVSDVLTGYFAWKKPALDALAPHVNSPGFAVEMEMITKMARLGLRMASVPISYHPRMGESHLHPIRDGLRILSMFLKNLTWHPRPQTENHTRPEVSKDTEYNSARRKIVFVSDAVYPYMKGGKEKRLYEITKHLAAMGHDVHIYTMHWWEEPAKTRFEAGVQLHAICKYREMYSGDRRSIKEGVLFGLACFKLFRVRFDVLDVDHMPFFPIFSAWLVCAMRGRKMNATWHEALSRGEWISYMGAKGVVASFIERLSVRLPHSITAASSHTKDLLETIHGRIDRVELVASGIDSSLLSTVRPAQIDCDVLFAGRLVKDKHVDKLIRAIDIIAQTHPEVRCIIIGEGIEKRRLQQEVARYKLKKNITFLEPLPHAADLYAIMKSAKVFCSPSLREGFGITILESLGCGTPVVTIDSSTNAARHLVKDGQNGSVVRFTSAAIAEALLYWISLTQKPDIAPQMADYDWQQLAQKQAEVYAP